MGMTHLRYSVCSMAQAIEQARAALESSYKRATFVIVDEFTEPVATHVLSMSKPVAEPVYPQMRQGKGQRKKNKRDRWC